MSTIFRAALAVTLGIAALVVTGCGGQKAQDEAAQAQPESSPAAGQGAGHGEAGTPAQPVTPAATAAAVWDQITGEQKKLEAAIQSGQLPDVHHLAFSIRDLVEALAARTTGLSDPDAAALKKAVADIRASAAKLDEYGDSGNLGATEKEHARAAVLLQQIKTLTARGQMSLEKIGPRSRMVQLAGEIIDPQCFFTHDGRGLKHAACAERCARGGQGLAFLDEASGRMYQLIAKTHGASQNEGLYPHIGRPVAISGVVFKVGENSVLLIQSIAQTSPKSS